MNNDKDTRYVSIRTFELQLLCEMAKSFLDAFGEEVENDEKFPGKKRQEDQRYLGMHVVWERADRWLKGRSEASPDNSEELQ